MALYIMDVADVTMTRKSDGHVVSTSTAQMSSLSQTVDEEAIQGGIGSRTIYTIKSNKQQELTVRDATFDLEYLAMTQGVAVVDDETLVVQKKVNAVVADGAVEAPEGATDSVHVINNEKVSQEVEIGDAGTVTVPHAADGEKVQIIYDEEVAGRSIQMRSDRFSEKYKAQYQTVVYDTETEKIHSDLYIVFNEVSPSAAFDMSLENGTAFTPELTFTASGDDDNVIGTWMLVKREEA